MEEMRQMIGRRGGEGTPRRPQSVILGNSSAGGSTGVFGGGGNMSSSSSSGSINFSTSPSQSQEWAKTLEELVTDAEREVARAAENHELLEKEVRSVSTLR